jgi:anti-anti-sigma factor
MEIYQEQVQSPTRENVQITILKLVGDLDGSNFREVMTRADEVCAAGASNLLIDLSGMRFMSSAGLATLHHIAVQMRRKEVPVEGYMSLDELKAKSATPIGFEPHVKLLSPQPGVLRSLQQVDYDKIFEIFTDRAAALAAFS